MNIVIWRYCVVVATIVLLHLLFHQFVRYSVRLSEGSYASGRDEEVSTEKERTPLERE